MQWINLVPERATVNRIQAEWRQAPVARAPRAVTPSPKVPSPRSDERTPVARQTTHERRRSERRRRQLPVLLDTRSHGDRRRAGPGNRPGRTPRHINLYA